MKDTRDKWKIPEGRTRSGGTDSLVNTFINGIEFAIGMVAGLVLLFYVARWVRLCYYRASKRTGDALPPDIRVRLIRDAIKGFARMRRSNPTEEQARDYLSGNLCRCGTYVEVLAAVKELAKE